ncbi:MAG: hypothetical protein V7K48_06075 [Nostoc sp.]|uniref:hypothetical protein n=1 Tax=Nostoc sp. TaxID=1180 RepID=UPI002FF9DD6C
MKCIGIVSGYINNAFQQINNAADALTMQADALALQGIAKFNSLRINEMLYLDWIELS